MTGTETEAGMTRIGTETEIEAATEMMIGIRTGVATEMMTGIRTGAATEIRKGVKISIRIKRIKAGTVIEKTPITRKRKIRRERNPKMTMKIMKMTRKARNIKGTMMIMRRAQAAKKERNPKMTMKIMKMTRKA